MLTEEQRHLYTIYHEVLILCSEEWAILKGVFSDLMYASENRWRFNEHKQYTLIRKYKNELLFAVVSFDSQSINTAINAPSHAFNFLQILQFNSHKVTDLMTNKEKVVCLLPYKATEVVLGAYTGKILEVRS